MQIFFGTGAIFFFKKDGCGLMSFPNLRQLMVHFRELHANQSKVKCTYSRSTGTCEYRLIVNEICIFCIFTELRKNSLLCMKMTLGENFRTKNKFWPVSYLHPNRGFGSGSNPGFESEFEPETYFRPDQDPKPYPKILFWIRNSVLNPQKK
jgi:hypothetical protein